MQFPFTLRFVQLEACAERDGVAVPNRALESAGHAGRDRSTPSVHLVGWGVSPRRSRCRLKGG